MASKTSRRRRHVDHSGQQALFPTGAPQDRTTRTTAFSDRDYQNRGVTDVVSGLRHGGRGQLHMACGTGKTKMARWSAEQLVPHGGVLVIVAPTVGLVSQTLEVWDEGHDHRALAVCGDESVNDDSFGSTEDILEPVTTDPDVVDAWLRLPNTTGLRLIVGTHASAHVIGEGLQKAGLAADLLVVDEAHRSAGWVGKHSALLHDDEVLPAVRRLYMTATPRIFLNDKQTAAGAAFSMDDEAVFGRALFSYPFSQAIADGWLDDYRLAVIGVTRAEVFALLREATDRSRSGLPSQHTAMVQAATARAAAELGLRRVIAFCPRIADAKEFARTFPHTLDALPEALRPRRALHADYIHGRMSQAQRREVLRALAEPPADGWSVISNARCLSEGIDVPAVDGIAFTAPKKSTVDIVQAVGRALRRDPDGSGTATIIVPVLLPDDHTDVDDEIDAGAFDVLWQVVRALRAHDDLFGTALDASRAEGFRTDAVMDRVTVSLPQQYQDPGFLEHLTIRLIKSATSQWWDGYHQLVDYHAREGNAHVTKDHITSTGFRLGDWASRTRVAYKQKRLGPDRVEALLKLGFVFDVHAAQWDATLSALTRFHEQHGHIDVPAGLTNDAGVKLRPMLSIYRSQRRKGTLPRERVAALDALGIDWEPGGFGAWDRMVTALRAYHAEHGDIAVPGDFRNEQGVNGGAWLSTQRTQRAKGLLTDAQIADLDALGMVWEKGRSRWERSLGRVRAYHARHAHINATHKQAQSCPDAAKVRSLVLQWISAYHQGTLPPDRVRALDELGIDWDPADGHEQKWRSSYAQAEAFHREFGHLDVPEGHTAPNGLRLDYWVAYQRNAAFRGDLHADRVALLDTIGMTWKTREHTDAVWDRGIAALREYRETVGPPDRMRSGYRTETGFRLYEWVNRKRRAFTDGTLLPEHAQQLTDLGVELRRPPAPPRPIPRALPAEPEIDTWSEELRALQNFHAEHGSINIGRAREPTISGLVQRLRAYHRAGKLRHDQIDVLDALGIDWEPRRTRRHKGITAARRYHAATGHLLPPADYTDDTGVNLTSWLVRRRAARAAGTMTTAEIAELDALGMVWDLQQAAWDEGLAAAAVFHADTGYLEVPGPYRGTGLRGQPYDLAAFLNRQRTYRRNGSLTPERIAALDALCLDWTPYRTRWEKNLAALRKYRECHGDLNVPAEYHLDGVDVGSVLGRCRHDHANGTLPEERVAVLDALGIVWSPKDTAWAQMIDFLRGYHAEHGDIQVPHGVRTPQGVINARGHVPADGVDVNYWLYAQRERRNAGELTDAQIADLNALGMMWEKNGDKNAKWLTSFAVAERFHTHHGHLDVPVHNPRNDKETNSLYAWVCRQRVARQNGTLSAERIAALDRIGMRWAPVPAKKKAWLRKYELVKAFRERHGHFDFRSVDPGDPEMLKLSRWLYEQRTLHATGDLGPDRVELLTGIGMDWRSGHEQAWDKAIERLKVYCAEVGDPNTMSVEYRSPDGFRLYSWLRRARTMADGGELSISCVHDLIQNGVRIGVAKHRRKQEQLGR